jgi:hypothetical protein
VSDAGRGRLSWAAIQLGADVDAVEALLRGLSVPRCRLNAAVLAAIGEGAEGGPIVLDDELALRVELARGAEGWAAAGERQPDRVGASRGVPASAFATRSHAGGLGALLCSLVAFLRRFVVLSAGQADAAALWVAHTYAIGAAEATPYLAVTSAEKRSGKTRLLDVLELLVARPWRAITPTEAVVFRKIERDGPTLLLDEVDAIFGPKAREHEGLRALLNAGNRRGTRVPRCVGPTHALQEFEVFCPKALAGIGELPDTLADRAVAIRLKRKAPGESVERFRRREVESQAEQLRFELEPALAASLAQLTGARPAIPVELDDRAADAWEPLFAIAELAGVGWAERARSAALALSVGQAREDESAGVRLLADVLRVFEESGRDGLTKAELLAALVALEDAPYGERERFTTNRLSRILKRYGVPSDAYVHDENGKSHRGWQREHFADAWTRYLPEKRATCADGLVEPSSVDSKACGKQAPHGSGNTASPYGYAVRTVRTLSLPLPGGDGYRDLLNRAHNAGQITNLERDHRRLWHDLLIAARPPAGEKRVLSEIAELVAEGALQPLGAGP